MTVISSLGPPTFTFQLEWIQLQTLENIPVIQPVYDKTENYDVHWGFADYRDKTILDLGADVGSTASWFLRHGARYVTALEPNPKWFKKLHKNFKNSLQVHPVHMGIYSEADMETALAFDADVVKVDIEGAEATFMVMPIALLRTHAEYMIETHSEDLAKMVTKVFTRAGFRKQHEFMYLGSLPTFHFVRESRNETVQVKPKTAILIPIYQAANYFPRIAAFLYELNPQPEIYIFAENNSTDGTVQMLSQFKRPHEIIRLWFTDDGGMDGTDMTCHNIIAIMRQFLLKRARQLDLDYAIFLDSDIGPLSRNMIESLCSWQEADIVGGPYLRQFLDGLLLDVFWKTNVQDHYQMRRTAKVGCLSLEPVAIVGGGCMRLNRSVLYDDRVNFYPRNEKRIPDFSEDHAYCLDAEAAGHKIALDTTVELTHCYDGSMGTKKAWSLGPDGKFLKFTFASKDMRS